MVLVGKSGLYHFLGVLVEVPECGEVEVDDGVGDAMKSCGFKVKYVRQSEKDKAPE